MCCKILKPLNRSHLSRLHLIWDCTFCNEAFRHPWRVKKIRIRSSIKSMNEDFFTIMLWIKLSVRASCCILTLSLLWKLSSIKYIICFILKYRPIASNLVNLLSGSQKAWIQIRRLVTRRLGWIQAVWVIIVTSNSRLKVNDVQHYSQLVMSEKSNENVWEIVYEEHIMIWLCLNFIIIKIPLPHRT